VSPQPMQFAAENEEKNTISFLLYSHTKEVIDPSRKRGHHTNDDASKHRLLDPLELFWIQKAPFYVCYV